jgi:hypothetical protein
MAPTTNQHNKVTDHATDNLGLLPCCHVAISCTVISLAAIGRVEGQMAAGRGRTNTSRKRDKVLYSYRQWTLVQPNKTSWARNTSTQLLSTTETLIYLKKTYFLESSNSGFRENGLEMW